MTTDLPDNVDDWPSDPHELLGVGPSSTLKVIRRAYFKLLRVFKPDEFPQEFQLIRSAYERASTWAKYRSETRENDDEFQLEPSERIETEWDDGVGSEKSAEPLRHQSLETGIASGLKFWHLAQAGKIEEAMALVGNATSQSDKYFEYNFASYFEDDLRDAPHDHIAAVSRIRKLISILDSGYDSYSVERELTAEFDFAPQLAGSDMVTNYLESSKNWNAVSSLTVIRWKAISCDRAETVVADIDRLRERFSVEQNWIHLLAESFEYTQFADSEAARVHSGAVWRELSEDIVSTDDFIMDEVDLLRMTELVYRKSKGQNLKWFDLVPYARRDLPTARRNRFKALRDSLDPDRLKPKAILEFFDLYYATPYAILLDFINISAQHVLAESGFSDRASSFNDQKQSISCLLASRGRWDFKNSRVLLLNYFLNNNITPLTFAECADQLTAHLANHLGWATAIERDRSLRSTYSVLATFNAID